MRVAIIDIGLRVVVQLWKTGRGLKLSAYLIVATTAMVAFGGASVSSGRADEARSGGAGEDERWVVRVLRESARYRDVDGETGSKVKGERRCSWERLWLLGVWR